MEADRKRAVARVIHAGRLPIVALAAAFLMVGCGGSTEPGNSNLQSENERLDEEVQRLQGEVERLQAEVEDVRETAETEVPETEVSETESTSQEDEVREAEPEESSGCGLAVAGPGDVSGGELPGIMPDDFPFPAGAVADYVSETDYSFSLNFVIDSEFDTTSAFYDEQLPAGGWEKTDRTEGTVEGLEGVETTWERGVRTSQKAARKIPTTSF